MNRIELVKDNLEFIKELINNRVFLDLIYIDPPFNKGRNFGEFDDNWTNRCIALELSEATEIIPDFISSIKLLKLNKATMNYLISMGIRCWYMRKLLKDTGSFYYHCDDTVGHYVRVLLDYIFGIDNFRNVITWQRTKGGKTMKNNYARNSDFIFYYTKSDKYTFNVQYKELSEGGLSPYRYKDEKGRLYCLNNLVDPANGNKKEWIIDGKVIKHPNGKGFMWTQETLDRKRKEHFEKYGTELIHISKNGVPRQMCYLEDSKGAIIDNIWVDIDGLNGCHKERLGYPTQKPEALLERIILASSNPGDKVADFYLGSGTTAAVAIKNGRFFIGCDINKEAVIMARERVLNLTK